MTLTIDTAPPGAVHAALPAKEEPGIAQWMRVKDRLRAELGEDIFKSWFGRAELEEVGRGSAVLSVPTKFLKSWITGHYREQLLRLWGQEDKAVKSVEIIERPMGRSRTRGPLPSVRVSRPTPSVPLDIPPVEAQPALQAQAQSVVPNGHGLNPAPAILQDLVGVPNPRRVMIDHIQRAVCQHYNISKDDLLSAQRTRKIVRPRQVGIYLAKILTPHSLPEIGRRFRRQDHTTVLHSIRQIAKLIERDQDLAHEIELLKWMIIE